MSGGGPDRATIRAASKQSALQVAAWNQANEDLSDQKESLATLLQEMVDSGSSNFGATVPMLRILCSLIPGAPTGVQLIRLNKGPLLSAISC